MKEGEAEDVVDVEQQSIIWQILILGLRCYVRLELQMIESRDCHFNRVAGMPCPVTKILVESSSPEYSTT